MDHAAEIPLTDPTAEQQEASSRLFADSGEMAALMRGYGWSDHPCGPPEAWPPSLRSAVTLILDSTFGMALAWGPEYYFFYNDQYRPILGATKHPGALGRPIRDVFPEIWPFLEEMFGQVRRGQAVGFEDLRLELERHNYREECFFTFSYSPWRERGGRVAGVLITVTETTAQVIQLRRLQTLRDLASAVVGARSAAAACQAAAQVLAANPQDLPWAALYLLDDPRTRTDLAGAAGRPPGAVERAALDPGAEPAAWPLAAAARAGQAVLVEGLGQRFGADAAGVEQALVIPIDAPGHGQPAALLIAGVSPRRALDDDYRGFLQLVARHIGAALSGALALEAERVARQAAEDTAERIAHLQAMTAALAATLEPEEVGRLIVREGLAALGAAAGAVAVLTPSAEVEILDAIGYAEGARQTLRRLPLASRAPVAGVVRTGQALWLRTPAEISAYSAYLVAQSAAGPGAACLLPLRVDERVIGGLLFNFAEPHAFDQDERSYCLTLAGQCAQALERARLHAAERELRAELEARVQARTAELRAANTRLQAELAERRRMLQQMEAWREAERKRIAQDLHDDLGSALTGLKMLIYQLRHRTGLPAEMDQGLGALAEATDGMVRSVRRIATELRPAILDDLGLLAALEWQFEDFKARSRLAGELRCNAAEIPLEGDRASACFRVFQEALTNVARHAQASRVEVVVDVQPEAMRLEVHDDGQGLPPARRAGRLGLSGMRERVDLIGGKLEIVSAPGEGTHVRVWVPLNDQPANGA